MLHNTSIILQHNNAAKYQIITICQTKTLHQESYISLRRKLHPIESLLNLKDLQSAMVFPLSLNLFRKNHIRYQIMLSSSFNVFSFCKRITMWLIRNCEWIIQAQIFFDESIMQKCLKNNIFFLRILINCKVLIFGWYIQDIDMYKYLWNHITFTEIYRLILSLFQ